MRKTTILLMITVLFAIAAVTIYSNCGECTKEKGKTHGMSQELITALKDANIVVTKVENGVMIEILTDDPKAVPLVQEYGEKMKKKLKEGPAKAVKAGECSTKAAKTDAEKAQWHKADKCPKCSGDEAAECTCAKKHKEHKSGEHE